MKIEYPGFLGVPLAFDGIGTDGEIYALLNQFK